MRLWAFCCSMCKKKCANYSKWLTHLLLPGHQALGRSQCQEWTSEVKQCAIVVYSAVPIELHAPEILQRLSDLTKGIFVTDFIGWPDRPKVGFVQFNSREKVDKIIPPDSNMADITFPNFRIQVKRAMDTIQLEWDEFFPSPSIPPPKDTVDTRKRKLRDENDGTPLQQRDPKILRKGQMVNGITTTTNGNINNKNPPNPPQSSSVPPDKSRPTALTPAPTPIKKPNTRVRAQPLANLSLKTQFLVIMQDMTIPESDFSQVLELIKDVQTILGKPFPGCRLHLFRHWYLKIKNAGTNELLIFLETSDYRNKPVKEIADLVEKTLISQNIKRLNVEEVKKSTDFELDPFGDWYFHERFKIRFSLVTYPTFLLEAQLCRLLKYMTTFDPRVIPLIALLNYWLKVNDLNFTRYKVSSRRDPFASAEPTTLEWLVIVFFFSQNLIPSVRDILSLSHKTLTLGVGSDTDIGFSEDLEYSKKWTRCHKFPKEGTDEYIASLLRLMHDFFEYYGKIGNRPQILNTKDAEFILADDILLKKPTINSKLTDRELKIVKVSLENVFLQARHFRIIHPLDVSKTLFFDNHNFFNLIRDLFKESAQTLELFKSEHTVPNQSVDLNASFTCTRK